MQLQPRLKRISLAYRGDGWQDCYIDFRGVRPEDLIPVEDGANSSKQLSDMFKRLFVAGKAVDANGCIGDLEAADLDQLDVEDLTTLSKALLAPADPNA